MAKLPYVTAPGNVSRALQGIKNAQTPESVSQDFVKTILGIPGGSGNQMTSFLRKIGFAGSDGKPTDIYTKFRNQATEGWAAAQALRVGYAPLFARNEYMYSLSDEDLRGLIIEETGASKDSTVITNVLSCIKQLIAFANWEEEQPPDKEPPVQRDTPPAVAATPSTRNLGLNLGYTINLHLPATSDAAVFNAIFRALKEHLLVE